MTKQIIESKEQNVYTDVVQTNGQIAPKGYTYKVTFPDKCVTITVIATSGTAAKDGLKQSFPKVSYIAQQIAVSDHLIQVNDQSVVDV
jgi:hypothetical protein